MTAGRELEEVEGEDGGGLDTGNVAEGADELLSILIRVVNDERSTALSVAAVSQLTLSGAELLGSLDLLDIGTSTDGLEEGEGCGCLGNSGVGEGGRGNDEGNLGDGGDLVATGEEESGGGRGSNGRGGGETPVVWVRLFQTGLCFPSIAHFWPRLIFWCHLRQTLVGANMRPERHMLPKAA